MILAQHFDPVFDINPQGNVAPLNRSPQPASPARVIDRKITVTRFDDRWAKTKKEIVIRFRDILEAMGKRTARRKEDLPLMKLATFGDEPSAKGSLRTNANMIAIDGIEVEHDSGKVSVDEAVERFREARVAAIVYTTPSHNPGHPRWRGLIPTSQSYPMERRAEFVARVHGLFEGELAVESFTASPAFYYGRIVGNPHYRAEIVDGRGIDEATELDAGALGRNGKPYYGQQQPSPDADYDELYPEPDLESIARAIEIIPIKYRYDREGYWRPIGMALHNATGGSEEAYRVWDGWSKGDGVNRCKKYDPVDQRRVWNSFGPYPDKQITLGTLFELCKKHGRTDDDNQIQLRHGGTYAMQKVDWLWSGWLALGKLQIIGGQKGVGKSTLVFGCLATITIGGKWPDGSQAPLGDVLIWSGEDDIADTILPRIVAAGGDLTRVHFVDRVIVDGVKRRFDPATDIPLLLEALRRLPQLRAVMIDPVVAASVADSHKNAETRRGLQPLVDLAEQRHIALIGVTHFTKNTQDKDPIERITGTLAYGALPRVVLGAAKGADERLPRRLVRIASNIGQSGGGFEYLLRQEPIAGHDFTAQRIEWGRQLVGDAKELLEGVELPQSEGLKAITFLEQILTEAGDAGVPVSDLKKAAEAHSFAWRTIERAKQKLKGRIEAKQLAGAPHSGWNWVWIDYFDQ